MWVLLNSLRISTNSFHTGFPFLNSIKQKFSFRVVFRHDIVPHSPGCKKDKSVNALPNGSQQCDPTAMTKPYHHGTEVWWVVLCIEKYNHIKVHESLLEWACELTIISARKLC